MRYRSDPILPHISYNSRRDEVTIQQVANDGVHWIVFKGFLNIGGKTVAYFIIFLALRLLFRFFHL